MQVERLFKKCAICGEENEFNELISNFIHGQPDLDLRQRGSMASLGAEIQMCPNCGYCNYDIAKVVQKRFEYNDDPLDLWKKYEDVQEIINSEYNTTIKKYLIMAKQYIGNLDHEKAYQMLLRASWATDIKELSLEIKKEAIAIYLDEILPEIRTKLLQFVDTVRQCGYFEPAKDMLDACELLVDEDFEDAETLKKIISLQNKLIEKKDDQIHNMSEI